MDLEIEYKIQRNKLRINRYKNFNWKTYFLRTFGFLLLLDLFMFLTVPMNLSNSERIDLLAISLWIILLVCVIFTPLIAYWNKLRFKTITEELKQLKEYKRIRAEHKSKKGTDDGLDKHV
jgi:hypothetical protein